MRLSLKQRSDGLLDANYCLQVSHKMLDIFQEEEKNNQGFNSLEMLMIKSLYDDLFENMIKSRYKKGRNQVLNSLSMEDSSFLKDNSKNNIINLFDFLED